MFISWTPTFLLSSALETLRNPSHSLSHFRLVKFPHHKRWSQYHLGLNRRRMINPQTVESDKHPTAKILSTSPNSISLAASRIRSGHLVSFPTETVYGLGCDALNPIAVQKVFQAKERPWTDPLILHVCEPEDAWTLWAAYSSNSQKEHLLLSTLTQTFWPGPLTLVAKAASHIPDIVMAHTGFVACRSPSHPIARALIQQAQVPIAAPSANKFGHVSPTRAQHVWDDLSQEDVWILDPTCRDEDETQQENVYGIDMRESLDGEDSMTVCKVGVESTVAKIEMKEDGQGGNILILRHGAISAKDIQTCLVQAQLDEFFSVLDNKMQTTKENVQHVAPGQCIRHYSPNVPSFMVDTDHMIHNMSSLGEDDIQRLKWSVVVDYGGKLISWKEYALAYRDLSVEGDPHEAASHVFALLRWSEEVKDGQRVFFPLLGKNMSVNDSDLEDMNPLLRALIDRLTRAASGKIITNLKQCDG